MDDALGPTSSRVRQAMRDAERLEILKRVGDLLIRGSGYLLVLAFDRQGDGLPHRHDVHPAVLPDDGLAERDLGIDHDSVVTEIVEDVRSNQVTVGTSVHCSLCSGGA